MAEDHFVHLGTRPVWGGEEPFGLRCADRRQHLYTIGKTGTGKTTLLKNLILQDIAAGRGVGVIDPHGDLAEDLLDHIPPGRTDDVVYFNPADQEHPVGFNLLRRAPADRRHLVAAGVVSIFKSIWRDSWGPRLEYILYAAVAALLECENTTLLGVQRMLSDASYRHWVVKQVRDPMVRSFWLDEFGQYDQRFLKEAISPIQNKVGQLLMAPPIRNILGQVLNRIDPGFMMDDRRILIANLAKGRLGAEQANLLGAVLVTSFQLAAMARADRPEHDRTDFYLYIDEFHNFSTDTFASILSEARKYRLCLTLSHQYLDQIQDSTRDAVLGNVGTIVAFRVSERDAAILDRELGGGYGASRFTDLANFEVWAKMLASGSYGDPFWGRTATPAAPRHGRRENIIRRSREKYGSSRARIENKINRWVRS